MSGLNHYNLLFLEDNPAFAKSTIDFFTLLFHTIHHAASIKEALTLFENHNVHLIISDIKVEDGNGLEFIRSIRARNREIPIIVLSAHKDEDFLFQAIPLGLTDYLLKPIAHDDLMASLKKANTLMNQLYCQIRHLKDDFYYDTDTRSLLHDKQEIPLTDKESRLIELLLKQPGTPTSKEMIEVAVYGEEGMSSAALKNLLLRLRKKAGEEIIQTIPGLGYRL